MGQPPIIRSASRLNNYLSDSPGRSFHPMVRYNIASLADMKRGKADESLRYFAPFFIVNQPSPIVVEHLLDLIVIVNYFLGD